jgi:hypothetical protein
MYDTPTEPPSEPDETTELDPTQADPDPNPAPDEPDNHREVDDGDDA